MQFLRIGGKVMDKNNQAVQTALDKMHGKVRPLGYLFYGDEQRGGLPASLFRSLPGFIRWKNCLPYWNNVGTRRRRILPVRKNGFRRIRLLASVRLPLCWCMICLVALFIRFVEMVEEHTILTG